MSDRLLSPRLMLCPASPVELAIAAANMGFAADALPEDLPTGWLMQDKSDGRLVGILSAEKQLTCLVDSARRRQGYAAEALARLALEGRLPSHFVRPDSDAARNLTAKIGYRPDRNPALWVDTDVAACARVFERDWRAAYRERVQACHRRLGIAEDYSRRHRLSLVEEAERLRSIGRDPFDREQYLAPPAASAWERLRRAAAAASLVINPVSAFRGLDYQASLLERKLAGGAPIDEILKLSAAPGFSEHHSGLALDLSTPESPPLEEAFETTPAFHWLSEHAAKFGFYLSYPRENPHRIGYEPWHWAWRDQWAHCAFPAEVFGARGSDD